MDPVFENAIRDSNIAAKEVEAGLTEAEIQHIAALRTTVFAAISRMVPRYNRLFFNRCQVFFDRILVEEKNVFGNLYPVPVKNEIWMIGYQGFRYYYTYAIYIRTQTNNVLGMGTEYSKCLRDEVTGLPKHYEDYGDNGDKQNPYLKGGWCNPSILRNGIIMDDSFRRMLKYD